MLNLFVGLSCIPLSWLTLGNGMAKLIQHCDSICISSDMLKIDCYHAQEIDRMFLTIKSRVFHKAAKH